MNVQVVNHVKLYRKEFQYTQQMLAKIVGVSRQSIISIEQGRYVPSLQLALMFAKTFNCATDDLFQLVEEA